MSCLTAVSVGNFPGYLFVLKNINAKFDTDFEHTFWDMFPPNFTNSGIFINETFISMLCTSDLKENGRMVKE